MTTVTLYLLTTFSMGKIEDAMANSFILKHSKHVVSEEEFLATKEPGFKEELVKRIKAGEDMNKRAFFDTTRYKIHRVGILRASAKMPDPETCSPADALLGILLMLSGGRRDLNVIMALMEPKDSKEPWSMRLSISGGDEREFREYALDSLDKKFNTEKFEEIFNDSKKDFFEARSLELEEQHFIILSGEETHEEFMDKILSTGCFNITSIHSYETPQGETGK